VDGSVRPGLEGADVVAIGMGLLFAGYAVAIWGYCLVRGYDVTFAQVFSPTWSPAATFQQGTKSPGTQTD
jgi:hypothetical protein